MKYLRSIYHFLAGIHFAILLISSTALFVILGTFLEAKTESHQYASYFTYGNPIFVGLLWGFFINILFSALRRWPFKTRHVPFLTTHLGLLMILGGALCKSYFGTQGSMIIMEGSGQDEIMLPSSFGILVEKKIDSSHIAKTYIPLETLSKKQPVSLFADLSMQLIEYVPHVNELVEAWIKNSALCIQGLKPIKVHEMASDSQLPELQHVRIYPQPAQPWALHALRTNDVQTVAQKVYLNETLLKVTDPLTHAIFFECPLADALIQPIHARGWTFHTELNFNFSNDKGFEDPQIIVKASSQTLVIPLDGENSLIPLYDGSYAFAVDLIRQPAFAFIQSGEDVYFFAFDPHGRVHSESFKQNQLSSMYMYDQGFGGYTVQAAIPFDADTPSRQDLENTHLNMLSLQLKQGDSSSPLTLAPPLLLLREACQETNVDFSEAAVALLDIWNKSPGWLLSSDKDLPAPLQKALTHLHWNKIPDQERKSLQWFCSFYRKMEPRLQQGEDLLLLLKQQNWPLLSSLEKMRDYSGPCQPQELHTLLTGLLYQIYSAGNQLPENHLELFSNTLLLTAYLRAYSIHMQSIENPPIPLHTGAILESLVTTKHLSASPPQKLEDSKPKILLNLKAHDQSEWAGLAYDNLGKGLKHPVLNGQYIVRFQSIYQKIPYRIRLRQGRQINYPNSQQPFSYESDLIITDKIRGTIEEKTISMNNVHETWDGYRFYMANITPQEEGAVKKVQIVVNHDPAKYWLTYPGACVMVLGIILLFWLRPYRKS
jgi:hypothetical protein